MSRIADGRWLIKRAMPALPVGRTSGTSAEALVARHGFDASEEQVSRLVACTLVDVKRNKLADVTYLEFSENHQTGKIGENLLACEGDPSRVFNRYCATEVQLAIDTPIEDATRKLDAVNQDLAQKQEQQLAQEQQQQSRSALG